jgi:hypothetical protein
VKKLPHRAPQRTGSDQQHEYQHGDGGHVLTAIVRGSRRDEQHEEDGGVREQVQRVGGEKEAATSVRARDLRAGRGQRDDERETDPARRNVNVRRSAHIRRTAERVPETSAGDDRRLRNPANRLSGGSPTVRSARRNDVPLPLAAFLRRGSA